VVTSLVMHHLPQDLRAIALQEMQRVLRPRGKLLIAEAQTPRHGLGWRLLARVHPLRSDCAHGAVRAELRRGCATCTRLKPHEPRDAVHPSSPSGTAQVSQAGGAPRDQTMGVYPGSP
jgi:SAM-dependent methyltransferase